MTTTPEPLPLPTVEQLVRLFERAWDEGGGGLLHLTERPVETP